MSEAGPACGRLIRTGFTANECEPRILVVVIPTVVDGLINPL
jgi:hypothetical protein